MADIPNKQNERVPANTPSTDCQAASIIICKYRDNLNWALSIPTWKNLIDDALDSLAIPSARQGVSRENAILALPIESKNNVLKQVLKRAPNRLQSKTAIKLATLWSIQIKNRLQLDTRLSPNNWDALRHKLILRLAIEHRKYKSAQNLLHQNYNALAQSIASKTCQDPNRQEDCLQEAHLGLIKAIDHIKTADGFCSYASHWISRHVRNFLLKNKLPVSAPTNAVSEALTIEALPASSPQPLAVLFNMLEQTSLPYDSLESLHASDQEKPDELAARSDTALLLKSAIQELSKKQRDVILQKFGLSSPSLTDTEISTLFGISRQQVGRRQKRALAKLFHALTPLAHELA